MQVFAGPEKAGVGHPGVANGRVAYDRFSGRSARRNSNADPMNSKAKIRFRTKKPRTPGGSTVTAGRQTIMAITGTSI